MKMNRKLRKYFISSIITAVTVCFIVFLMLVVLMSGQTQGTLTDISNMYMSEMNLQLQQKFNSITNLRLDQVDGIVRRTPPSDVTYGKSMLDQLNTSAEVRDIAYLGLYSKSGEEERIRGEELFISNYDNLLLQLGEGDLRGIGVAKNAAGDKYFMFGVAADYPLKNGGKSMALIAGVSMEYLNQALYLDEKEANMYSHVIDGEGNFVIRNGDAYRENYFQRLKETVEKTGAKKTQDLVNELRDSIRERKTFSADVKVDGEIRRMYCSPVSDRVDWYWISIMTNRELDVSVTRLDRTRLAISVSSVAVILIMMMIIFIIYFQLSRKQMKELAKSRKEAVDANMAKSEFLSSMSHDIRTPMNAIIGMTEIAMKNPGDRHRVEDCLNKVKLSSKQLLGLINDVLDMSKIESGKMTLSENIMSLREVMDDIVNIVRPQVMERNQFFDIFIQNIKTEKVYCDEVRLNQVLLNLLSNALKFTPENGRIDVHLYQEESPKGPEYIRNHFLVEDTGIGMSEEFQKKIFDSFAREDTEQVRHIVGTGLGTSITKSIITLMGGTIEVKSEQGKGSCFHIIVDLKCAEPEEEMVLPDWRVLVVDDNEQLCVSAVSNLEELGVRAEWTQDGGEAVRMIEDHHNRGEDYHFVLIDWKMPDMDGVQTMKEIRSRVDSDVPIFLISAYDWGDIEEQLKGSHFEGFIAKPLFKSTLYTHLKQYVEGAKKEAVTAQEEFDFQGRHILLAEDIDINWEIANEILSSVGLVLERAENGKICVDMFVASEPGYYDAVLMDVRMPVMNGYDATRAIRALDRPDHGLPIIAMTADAFSDDAKQCFESGMDAHLTKPLDIKECMRTLEKYLSEGKSET